MFSVATVSVINSFLYDFVDAITMWGIEKKKRSWESSWENPKKRKNPEEEGFTFFFRWGGILHRERSSSMAIFTPTSSPSASSFTSSVTKKPHRRFWRVLSWYNFHKFLRPDKLSAWTVRHTQLSVTWTRLVPAGSRQVCTVATTWSNEDQRLSTSTAETTVRPPATTLNTVFSSPLKNQESPE